MIQTTREVNVSQLLASETLTGTWALDPSRSTAEFQVKYFWRAMTVKGAFHEMTGEATVGSDRTVTGRISFDARSLNTKNNQRDKHLRSADFFDIEKHPNVVLTVTSAPATGPTQLQLQGTFEAGGRVKPVTFTARVKEASSQAAVLIATLELNRSEFGMTWNPIHIASMTVRGVVEARFVRPWAS